MTVREVRFNNAARKKRLREIVYPVGSLKYKVVWESGKNIDFHRGAPTPGVMHEEKDRARARARM